MIREATMEDLPTFLEKWQKLMEHLAALGGEMVPGGHNLMEFARLFEGYVTGQIAGTCLFWEDADEVVQAVLLWGEDWHPARFEHNLGRVAQGWGMWIEPAHRKHGISNRMRAEAATRLRDQGIDTLVGTILAANEDSYQSSWKFGGRPHATVGIYRLKE